MDDNSKVDRKSVKTTKSLKVDNNKNIKTYKLNAKRGYTFEEKRIEIDGVNLRYFNPNTSIMN